MGSTFAILPAEISQAGQSAAVPFTISSTEFQGGRGGRITLGFDVVGNSTSTVSPVVATVQPAGVSASGHGPGGHRTLRVEHARYASKVNRSSNLDSNTTPGGLVTVNVPKSGAAAAEFTAQIKGRNSTTGNVLVGLYLPGDADGDGKITKTDLKAVKSEIGLNANSSKYSFDADANRDGQINGADLRIVQQNMGASTVVVPVVQVNLNPASDSYIQDRITDIRTVNFTGTSTPGATITFTEIDGKAPTTSTVVDSNGNFSLDETLGNGANNFKVTSSDGLGQTITGQIATVTYTTNPPKVVTPSDLTGGSSS
jgi:hypothetical protein